MSIAQQHTYVYGNTASFWIKKEMIFIELPSIKFYFLQLVSFQFHGKLRDVKVVVISSFKT